ncbi:hypothetical protein ACWF82_20535 [Nocardia sp. NPDC055053]
MAVEPLVRIKPSPVRPALLTIRVVAVVGLLVIALTPFVVRPDPEPVVVRGKMGSKVDFFRDSEVQKILAHNNFDVRVDSSGSREVAVHDIDDYDFVFPSGQPAADLITRNRQQSNKYVQEYVLFSSPIVLATFRPFAQALSDAGVAEPVSRGRFDPLYYKIDIGKFVALAEQGKSWDSIGIGRYGSGSGNVVVAHTSDVCVSNSGGTYVAVVAYAKYGQEFTAPKNESQVVEFAEGVKPIYAAQGAPIGNRMPYYLSPEGKAIAPVVAIYEHQYLAYQLNRPDGKPDEERVLLYPRVHFETQPRLLALNDTGRKLAQLLHSDPKLRTRAVKLGFRMLDSSNDIASAELNDLLVSRGLQAPASADSTHVSLPPFDVFEKFVVAVGGCSQ